MSSPVLRRTKLSVGRYFILEGRGIEKRNDHLMVGGVMNSRAATFPTHTEGAIPLSLSELFCGFGAIACFLTAPRKCGDEKPGSMGCYCSK